MKVGKSLLPQVRRLTRVTELPFDSPGMDPSLAAPGNFPRPNTRDASMFQIVEDDKGSSYLVTGGKEYKHFATARVELLRRAQVAHEIALKSLFEAAARLVEVAALEGPESPEGWED